MIDSADGDHSFNRSGGLLQNVCRQIDHILIFSQRLERVFKRDLIHVRTSNTAKAQHVFLRIGGRDVVAHGALSEEQIMWRRTVFDEPNHRTGASGKI